MRDPSNVLSKVSQSLGRAASAAEAPAPPELPEHLVRLVHSEFGLPELFATRARAMKMQVGSCYVEEIGTTLIAFLREHGCQQIGISTSKLLDSIGLPQTLREGGFDVRLWGERSAEHALDAGVTEAAYAVAETGSIVLRYSVQHGRHLSLVPRIHVVILEPKNFVADLVDLMERLKRDGVGSHLTLINGPDSTPTDRGETRPDLRGPAIVHALILS